MNDALCFTRMSPIGDLDCVGLRCLGISWGACVRAASTHPSSGSCTRRMAIVYVDWSVVNAAGLRFGTSYKQLIVKFCFRRLESEFQICRRPSGALKSPRIPCRSYARRRVLLPSNLHPPSPRANTLREVNTSPFSILGWIVSRLLTWGRTTCP